MNALMKKLIALMSALLLFMFLGYTGLIVSDVMEIHNKLGYDFPYIYIQQVTAWLVFILCILSLSISLLNSGRVRVVMFSVNCVCILTWFLLLGFEVVSIIDLVNKS